MQKKMKYILILLFTLSIIPSFAIKNLTDWKPLTGRWNLNENWITPSEDKGIISPWAIVRADLNEESLWEEINSDFQIESTMKNSQFGLLLNVKSKNDYQLLRIYNSATNPVIQMLHWQYGIFRIWQEIKLSKPLSAGTTYKISLKIAPMKDKEDWRQWKIIITDQTENQIILKQGIENEQPAFGMGSVGLYSGMTGIRFCNFTIISKKYFATSKVLRLAPLFSDGMVIQQQAKIKIWGKANADEKIRIEIAGKSYQTVSNKTGDWEKIIPPLKAQRGLLIKVTAHQDSVIVHDVAVGEVWLASGQSNMEMRVWQTNVSEDTKELLRDNDLRFFLQPQWPAPHSCFNSGGEWVKADSDNIMGWSAVALSFALELRKKLQVPIGIISSNWGGTAIESWIPRSKLATDSITSPILKRMNQYQIDLEKGNLKEDRFPWCWDVPGQRHAPGDLYNGMITPHIPFAIKGVIWYQGESNSNRAKQYEHLLPMLISSWREKWQNPKMNFYFVQLAGYDGKQSGSDIENAWPHIREAQRLTLNKTKNTGMVVTIDLGQVMNIHPPFKKEVGIRLSSLALHDVYRFKDVIRSSPLYKKVIFKSGQSFVYFSETGSGLKLLKGEVLDGFTIAGEDHRFVSATAIIQPDGRSVRVFSKEIQNPVAVRYGWDNFPSNANLGNSANLPASPFRTDDWYLETDNDR